MIKVILADDQKILIDGLKALIAKEEDIIVVGEASNGEEVIALLEKNEVDVAVLDIEMPKLNGIDTTRYIKSHYPNVKVLVLSMYDTRNFIVSVMNIGAWGYILKNKSSEELISAIRSIHSGRAHFGLEVLDQIANTPTVTTAPKVQLSARELEVLKLIASAMSTKEIAQQLILSPATVDTHRRNLLSKIGVPSDKHLVLYAVRHGIITV